MECRVLVTGHKGFIGQNLVPVLESDGWEVSGADYAEKDDPVNVTLFDMLCPRMGEVDAVVHLAGLAGIPQSIMEPAPSFTSNVRGSFNVLEAARTLGIKRVIFASSAAADQPISPYGAYKAAVEAMFKAYHFTFGMETVILRFSNVYGPYSRHKTSIVARWCRDIIEGRPVTVYGDGEQRRDFIYAPDLVQGIRGALRASGEVVAGKTYELGTGLHYSINQLRSAFEWVQGIIPDTHYEHRQDGDIRAPSVIDRQPALKDLAFASQTRIEDGIEATYEWFQKTAIQEEVPTT